jgi:diadenosine tetraphosphate (Ap4A) HIT family hydrolase
MAYDDTNVFAKILRGEIPAKPVYEDDFAFAFNDIRPQAPIHVLVIPRGKYISVADFGAKASPEELAGFWRAVSHVAELVGALGEGFRLISNSGPNSLQEVPHFHVHILGGKRFGALLV